ncbi:hypothetical protein GUITHDRAFT_100753 [Guillardia theta CCMP2712]|uniref:RWP-RK domain-containing protein n=2 Tax=Guillardia theta TaxID=55529 RepID=L1K0A9_GUITC|nr:hypothetical protein GUITHDRAFT_100753 [Guillardia theta CCMP2712]EKX53783.1 hypothetical protein GUITHDRAFT_100753 [Guillardia theta CCMP2712]|eukprot:XP_005840763.1 hypothetical protein GUITHDRAFT_100753 [Guillardia theta CCMP2712]
MQASNLKTYRRSVAMVCPRKKRAQETQLYDSLQDEPVLLTRELLESFFDRPLVAVSQELGICPTAIKRACRKLGIARWPFKTPNPGPKRKRQSIQPPRLSSTVSSSSEPTDVESLSCGSPDDHQSGSTDLSVDITFDDICEVVNQSSCDLWYDNTRQPFAEDDEQANVDEPHLVINGDSFESSLQDYYLEEEDQFLPFGLTQVDEAPFIWN